MGRLYNKVAHPLLRYVRIPLLAQCVEYLRIVHTTCSFPGVCKLHLDPSRECTYIILRYREMRLMSRGAGVVQTSSRGIKRRSMSHNPEGMRNTSQGPAESELHPEE